MNSNELVKRCVVIILFFYLFVLLKKKLGNFLFRFVILEWITIVKHVASQFYLVSPRDHFVCLVSSFSEMKEIG